MPTPDDQSQAIPANAVSGDVASLAGELQRYADLGVGTVIISVEPGTPAAVVELGRAAARYRG